MYNIVDHLPLNSIQSLHFHTSVIHSGAQWVACNICYGALHFETGNKAMINEYRTYVSNKTNLYVIMLTGYNDHSWNISFSHLFHHDSYTTFSCKCLQGVCSQSRSFAVLELIEMVNIWENKVSNLILLSNHVLCDLESLEK